ncbi:MAG: alpha/beta hydrolase [Candidatus Paceibacterota bacterium]
MQEHIFEDRIYYRNNEFKLNKPTLIFIHGLIGSSSAWLPYEKIFENRYNILIFDIRGHGKSKKFPNYFDYEIKYFANDLHELILYLNISKFILISHSFGTLIALEYIKLFKENVIGNILLSPIIGLEKSFSAKIIRFILKLSKIFNLFKFNTDGRAHTDYIKYKNSTDWNIKRNLSDMKNTTLRVYSHVLRQSLNPDQEYSLEKIRVPTLIIHGEKDTMAPVKNAVVLSKKIKNSELILIPNTDHIVALNNIKEISEIIESFIEKNPEVEQSSLLDR